MFSHRFFTAGIAPASLLLLAACGGKDSAPAAAPTPAASPKVAFHVGDEIRTMTTCESASGDRVKTEILKRVTAISADGRRIRLETRTLPYGTFSDNAIVAPPTATHERHWVSIDEVSVWNPLEAVSPQCKSQGGTVVQLEFKTGSMEGCLVRKGQNQTWYAAVPFSVARSIERGTPECRVKTTEVIGYGADGKNFY